MTTLPAATLIEVEYWPDTALRLRSLAARPWFVLLDSCRHAPGAGRWDIAAWDPVAWIESIGAITRVTTDGGVRESHDCPLATLRAALGPPAPRAELPFTGGAIGAFSYDLARRWERSMERDHA